MVVVMMCGSFLTALNQNLMNTSLPTLMDVFDVSAGTVQWLISAYTLANGVMIPVTAYLVNRFTTRQMYFVAMSLFTLGTIMCAAAPVFGLLLTGRVVQALGAGISMTLMQTVMFTVFPVDRRGTAMGFFGLVISFAPAIGPTLAGVIVDSFPWQMLFIIQLPVVIILMALAAFLVRNVTGGKSGSLDSFSVVLSTIGFGGLLYGFSSASSLGFTSLGVIIPIIVGAIGIACFVLRQLHLEVPILEFRVFAKRGFTSALLLSVGGWALFMGTAVMLPLFMQEMNGFSATQSGLTMMAGGFAMGILSPITGNIFDRYGPRFIVPVGFVLMCGAQASFAFIGGEATMLYLAIGYLVFLVGLTMCNMPLTTSAINTLPKELVAHGSAMNNTMRMAAAAMAVAICVTTVSLLAGPSATGPAQIPAVQTVFAALSVCAGIMCIASLVIFRNTQGSKAKMQEL